MLLVTKIAVKFSVTAKTRKGQCSMARRGENIYKRRDGRWEARYIKTRTLEGKAVYGYIYRRSYLEAKRAQAEAKITSVTGKVEPHSLRHPKNLEAYLTSWLPLIQESVKKSTFANYSGLIRRHIIPDLGKVPLEQLSSALVQDYINRKLKRGRLDGTAGLSVKTVKDSGLRWKRSRSGMNELSLLCGSERYEACGDAVTGMTRNPTQAQYRISRHSRHICHGRIRNVT